LHPAGIFAALKLDAPLSHLLKGDYRPRPEPNPKDPFICGSSIAHAQVATKT
jgi:hypothetical protein